MRDLTEGSVGGHLVRMAVPIAIGMVFQTLYYLVDLFFVARLGDAAIAGVSAAGTVQFLVMALTQVLGIGTMAAIAQASGRKDRADANLVFNQSLGMAVACGGVTMLAGYLLAGRFVGTLGADAATRAAGETYLLWLLPGLALQYALVSMGSALRGTGIVKPAILVQSVAVLLNAALDPILIAGWLTGRPMGVAGAGVATSVSIAVAIVLMVAWFRRLERYVGFDATLVRPRRSAWARILFIGFPPGGEFVLMFVYAGLVYWAIRRFGAEAQAGFGIGVRVVQAIFVPALAVALATGPVAGQNVGAGRSARVRATFRAALAALTGIMALLTLVCQVRPAALIGFFSDDPSVIAAGTAYLRIISFNFVATGVVFTCSGMFQALGNTLPSLAASGMRLVTFAAPVVWMAGRPWFELRQVWYVSVVTVLLQAVVVWWLLAREMRRRLPATREGGEEGGRSGTVPV